MQTYTHSLTRVLSMTEHISLSWHQLMDQSATTVGYWFDKAMAIAKHSSLKPSEQCTLAAKLTHSMAVDFHAAAVNVAAQKISDAIAELAPAD